MIFRARATEASRYSVLQYLGAAAFFATLKGVLGFVALVKH